MIHWTYLIIAFIAGYYLGRLVGFIKEVDRSFKVDDTEDQVRQAMSRKVNNQTYHLN